MNYSTIKSSITSFKYSPPKGWIFDYAKLPKNKSLQSKANLLRKAGVLSEVLFWQAFKHKSF